MPAEPDAESDPAAEAESDINAAPLPLPGAAVEAQRYETDLMGVSITFDVPEASHHFFSRANRLALASDNGVDVGGGRRVLSRDARVIEFMRVGAWNSRAEAAESDYIGAGSIAIDHVDGWVADNDVILDRLDETIVANRATTVFDVTADPAGDIALRSTWCDPEYVTPCFYIGTITERSAEQSSRHLDPTLTGDTVNRFWLIRIEGYDPLLVQATAGTGDEAWLDLVGATTIATLELGNDAPAVEA